MSDVSRIIDPVAFTSSAASHTQPVYGANVGGVKHCRSCEHSDQYGPAEDDKRSRNRSRPPKTLRTPVDFSSAVESVPTRSSQTPPQFQTARPKSEDQQAISTPTQNSPPLRATPKSNVKALPTRRDHTSDQLTPEGDEYIPRESDPEGDNKVDTLGYLQGGREYRMRTFVVVDRGQKLFMFATECAKVLAYRDSYLLFKKNKSLYKIIASEKEKENLIARDVLANPYRSRQTALVTARSMFRQFGGRVIHGGRRVRDDYWEAKARKRGFTEADAAGEKLPGGGTRRQAAAQSQVGARQMFAPGSVACSKGPGFENTQPLATPHGITSTMAVLPMITLHDSRYRDIPRPRQHIAGPAFGDLTRSSAKADLLSKAHPGGNFIRAFKQPRWLRENMLEEWWNEPLEPPVSTANPQSADPMTSQVSDSSPCFFSNDVGPSRQDTLLHQPQQSINPLLAYLHKQDIMQLPVCQSDLQRSCRREHYNPQHPPRVPQPYVPRSAPDLSMFHAPAQSHQYYSDQFYSTHPMDPPQHQQMPQGWGAPSPRRLQSPGIRRMPTPEYSPFRSHTESPGQQQHSAAPTQSTHHGRQQKQQQQQPQHCRMLLDLMSMYGQAAADGSMDPAGLDGMGYAMYQQKETYVVGPGGQSMANQDWIDGQGGSYGMGGVMSAEANYDGQEYH